MTVEQTLRGELHAVFGDHAEDDVFGVDGQELDECARFRIIENVEGLLFERLSAGELERPWAIRGIHRWGLRENLWLIPPV